MEVFGVYRRFFVIDCRVLKGMTTVGLRSFGGVGLYFRAAEFFGDSGAVIAGFFRDFEGMFPGFFEA